MTTRDPIKILADIIQNQMALEDEQVLVYNQKWDLRPNYDLFVSVAVAGPSSPIGNTRRYVATEQGGLKEVQKLHTYEPFNIEIFSRDASALKRRNDLLLALGSTFSQQQQEKYGMRIDTIGSLQDLSSLEGTAILNRYRQSIGVYYTCTKEADVDYFNRFRLKLFTDPKREVKDIDIQENK
jgi:hypothetical protein